MAEVDYPLKGGGSVEIFDFDGQVVVEITFSNDRDGLVITACELRGNELQITLEERY